jgi:hypothetical protein
VTGRDETVAQARMFLDTVGLLAAGKLSRADANALLFGQALPVIDELLAALSFEAACTAADEAAAAGDPFPYPDLVVPDALPMPALDGDLCGSANPQNVRQVCTAQAGHPEKWHAVHGAKGRVVDFWPAPAECECCDDGQCPACVTHGCTGVRDRITAEFPPATPELPWQCTACSAPCGTRCWINKTHDADVPVCREHSVITERGVACGDCSAAPAGPVHWLNLDDAASAACFLAADADVPASVVTSATDKATVTCADCRALPEFGGEQSALKLLSGGAR